MVRISAGILVLFGAVFFSCDTDTPNTNAYIPSGPVSLVINTDLPEYYHLKTPGTYLYQPGGHRGVIVIHDFDDKYYAIERTCSFEPDQACAKIYVDSSSLNLRCGGFNSTLWQACCESKFNYNGWVYQGPAQYALRTYPTALNGAIITVRN